MTKKSKTEKSELGELQNVYHVKFGGGQIFMYSFVCFPLALFTIAMFATKQFLLLIFVFPLAAAFFVLLRLYFQERNDELSIYQNGFTYKSRKELQSCLWKEIEYVMKGKWKTIYGVRKKNGEPIFFSDSMQGIDDLTAGERAKLLQ